MRFFKFFIVLPVLFTIFNLGCAIFVADTPEEILLFTLMGLLSYVAALANIWLEVTND